MEDAAIDANDVLVGARWLHFGAVFLLFGGGLFWSYAGVSFASVPWSARATTRLLRVSALVAVASGLVWLAASVATMTGGFAGAFDPGFLQVFFFQTPFGPVELCRLALLAALLPVAFLPGADLPVPARRRFAALAALAALLLVSQAWLGHAAEGGSTAYGWMMIASYAVHVLAGAAWIGGLPILILVLPEQRRISAGAAALTIFQRFSTMATLAAGAVLASGVANTAFRIRSVTDALATDYGRVLLAKLAFVALTLGLAAVTRFVVMPRRLRGAGIVLALEVCFGACVLAAAAVLGITPPPR